MNWGDGRFCPKNTQKLPDCQNSMRLWGQHRDLTAAPDEQTPPQLLPPLLLPQIPLPLSPPPLSLPVKAALPATLTAPVCALQSHLIRGRARGMPLGSP